MRIPILPLLVGITLLLCAQATQADSPKRLTLLADSFSQDSLSAMRAETRVRGLTLEEMHASSLAPDIVAALAQRPNVVAVLYLTSGLGENSLWAVASDGRRSHASVPYDVEARTIAAIAHSLIDDLVHPATVVVAVDVNVDVQVRERGITPTPNPALSMPRWIIDVGGIVVSDEIWAAHAGVLRTLQPNLRFGVHGTVAQLPNDGLALAASADLSRIWGTRLRFELGARGLFARIYDNYGACDGKIQILQPCESTRSGMGLGLFSGVGHAVGAATFYLRLGADVMTFPGEGATLAPNGGVGVELAL